MDHLDQRQRAADLVPLEWADHVPGDVAAGEGLGLRPELLRPALAQGAATAGQKRLDQLDSDVLGDRDEANVAGPASAPHGRFGNPSFDFSEILADPFFKLRRHLQ